MAEPKSGNRAVHSRVAIVGGDTLLAKELRERIEEAGPPAHIELISATLENSSVLDPGVDDEPVIMSPLNADSLAGAQVAFLAGSAASSRRALKTNPPDGPALIDLTGALEDLPQARLRAPSVIPSAGPASSAAAVVYVIANPAAIALATLLGALARLTPISRSLVHIFEPASERGKKGIEELQQQTVAILAFKKLKKDVFDAQLGFNLLARYGEEAPEPLEEVEARIARHLASLLAAQLSASLNPASAVPMPSLRVIQAPVFHGHSFSVWVEFAQAVPGSAPEAVKTIERCLEKANLDVRSEDPPTNAGIAGQSGLSVGAIRPDANHPRAYWIWMVADNLRLISENAVTVAEELW